MYKIFLILRTVKHLSLVQTFYRIKYIFKRKSLTLLNKIFPFIFSNSPRSFNFEESDNLPISIFKPKSSIVEIENDFWVFNFLYDKHKFKKEDLWSEYKAKNRLWMMTFHYFEWISNLTDEDLTFCLKSWINDNRPFTQESWHASWNSYSISLRSVSWMVEYEKRKNQLDSDDLLLLRNSILEQLIFLSNNLELDLGGNHLIKNIKALLWGDKFFDNQISNRFALKANKLLEDELKKQILDDGFHFELSPSYHLQVFEDLLECYVLLPDSQLKLELATKLKKMSSVVTLVSFPDGKVSLLGDSGFEMSRNSRELLEAYSKIFIKERNLGHATHLHESNYFVFRNHEVNLIYDAGHIGPSELPAHSHGDIFSFELCLDGQRIIVDKGVYEYEEGDLRALSRSTCSHNTLSIDGEDQAEFWSSFRVGRRPSVILNKYRISNDLLEVDAEHDGFSFLEGAPLHRRVFKFEPTENYIYISDLIKSGVSHRTTSKLLLHPEVEIINVEDYKALLKTGKRTLLIESKQQRISLEKSLWWPNLGQEYSCKELVFLNSDSRKESQITIKID